MIFKSHFELFFKLGNRASVKIEMSRFPGHRCPEGIRASLTLVGKRPTESFDRKFSPWPLVLLFYCFVSCKLDGKGNEWKELLLDES